LKLDRETEALVYWASSSTATPLWQLSPEAARAEYRRGLAKMEIAPPEIGETRDLSAPGPAGKMRLRSYTPGNAGSEAEAAILFMHGGGCVIGDLETHDIFCRSLCHDTGATVLSLDYGLRRSTPSLPRWKTPRRRLPGSLTARRASASMRSGSRSRATALALDLPPSRCTRPRGSLWRPSARRR